MYRCFPMPTNLPSDTYVSAIDIKPGDRQTVHHVIAYIDTSGDSQKLDDADPGPGYTSFGGPGFSISSLSSTLGGWAPGARPVMLPEDVALSLPAQSRIVLQVHYHPHGIKTVPDQTQIGIYFAKKKPNNRSSTSCRSSIRRSRFLQTIRTTKSRRRPRQAGRFTSTSSLRTCISWDGR